MEWRKYIRAVSVVLLLYLLYQAGFPVYYLPLFGILLLMLVFMRGSFYRNIDGLLERTFPSTKDMPSWARKVLILLIFILAYTVAKQTLFFLLKLVGIDIQKFIFDSVVRMQA